MMMMKKKEDIQEDVFPQIQEWVEEYKNTDEKSIKKNLQNLIVVAAMPFVKRLARGIARRATDPFDDLTQVGALGLMKAIEYYNPEYGTKFKTYATYLIMGEIRHYLRDKSSMIKTPREIQELSYRINEVIKELSKVGEDILPEKIAEILSLPVSKVNFVIEVDRRKKLISLDQTVVGEDDDNISLVERIPAKDYKDSWDFYEAKMMLSDAIKKLKEPYKEIVELSYYEGLNQREISEKLNLTQMQISRKFKHALNDIYKIITEKKVEKV